jgi:hypothetical protein
MKRPLFFRRLCVGAAWLFAAWARAAAAHATEFFVAPGGNDGAAGSAAAPFATITRARDAVRALREAGGAAAKSGVTVWLRGGYYDLAAPLEFDGRDGGAPGDPVVYAGWRGEQAHVTGATPLDGAWFARVDETSPGWARLDATARGQVYTVNLRAHGIDDFGKFRARGFDLHAASPMELTINGRALTLGRWPNRGASTAQTAGAPSSTQITLNDGRAARWAQAKDGWLHGLWAQNWADYHLPIASITPDGHGITLGAAPAQFGSGSNRPFYAYNLLEEIDEPGEYYADRATGLLAVWPEVALAGAVIRVSRLEEPLVRVRGASHLAWRNVTFEATRGALIAIEGGTHVTFERCLLRNAGQCAALIDGHANGLDQCEILECGEEGVRLRGGNRATLEPGKNFVTNSRISRVGRLSWAYKPGVSLEGGCGNAVVHDSFDDLPHAAIVFTGNNHLISYNEIQRTCLLTGDAGAIYTNGGWAARGTVIRHNFIHDIAPALGEGAHGVYLDDCASGIEVFGNVFYRVAGTAIFCGGGRDVVMRNNVIAACGAAHFNDDRGRQRIVATPGDNWNLLERLGDDGVRYRSEPWASAFPAAAAIPDSWRGIQSGRWRNPEGGVFARNAGWDNAGWLFENNSSGTGVFAAYALIADNLPASPALFAGAAAGERSERPPRLQANIAGFQPIPFAEIGRPDADDPTLAAPPAPRLAGGAESFAALVLRWTDDGRAAGAHESGFDLEEIDGNVATWRTVRTLGAGTAIMRVDELRPGTHRAFRIRAFNAAGSAYSNTVVLATPTAPTAADKPTRVEAESPLTVVNDTGKNGAVDIANGKLDSGGSVRLYDPGDAISIAFVAPEAGAYRIGVRVRSGGTTGATTFWPAGYVFKLDGAPLSLTGERASVSALDPAYGGCFWGTMSSVPLTLAVGRHTVEVAAASAWAVVDYLEFKPVAGESVAAPPPSESTGP